MAKNKTLSEMQLSPKYFNETTRKAWAKSTDNVKAIVIICACCKMIELMFGNKKGGRKDAS